MSNTDTASALYVQVLGRPADSGGLATAVAELGSGVTAAQLQTIFATSPEAQADLRNAYLQILGRPIDSGALTNLTAALSNGEPLAKIETSLATSPEAQADLTTIYQDELARAPDSSGLASFEVQLANGGSLSAIQASIASGPEAQNDLTEIYQSDLGRAPDTAGLAGWTQFLASGGSLSTVQSDILNGPEVTGTVTSAYQSALGHGPDAVQLAAARSELASGVPSSTLKTELGELSGGAPPHPSVTSGVAVTPQTISNGGSTPSYVYSVLNNDALITAQPAAVALLYSGPSGFPVVNGFNPATDVVEVQSKQDASFSDLHFFPNGPNTFVYLGGGGILDLIGVPQTSLQASNFKFA